MRTGACTVQQALTAEAASILKLSLTLAKRRGHAQVTPLHVAATLLSSSSSSSNLLRRACLKSHPHYPASHPLQCRALELCFNVALNRLPTTPPPSSSSSLIHSQPSLSNALIAALKRAQAHQRRGCIELQQQQPQQQQQPLLAIKVELEQLIISILDDPSVSRVMREAGFSSTCVKNNLEEESSVLGQSSPPFFFESHKEILSQGSFWQSQFLKPPSELNPLVPSSQKEDLRVVLEVMIRKQGKRNNTVVVGDSVSMTEGLVAELMGRVERGEVPDELKSAHFIKLQLSYVHLRLMSRGDVDMKVADLRRKICSLASDRVGRGVIIYAGDLRWAVDEETKDGQGGFRPVEHMIGEVGRLLSELRSGNGTGCGGVINKVWLLATASYQTYMRCQMRQPSLETQWALQAVAVPSGGLALSLQAPSGLDSRMTKLSQHPFQRLELKAFNYKEEEEKLICCAECSSNFEKEASVLKSDNGSSHLPIWLQLPRPDNHHKDALPELRRKWNRLCQSLHHGRHNQSHPYHPPLLTQGSVGKSYNTHASSQPWWSSSLPHSQNKIFIEPHSMSFPESVPKLNGGSTSFTSQIKNRTGNWQEREAPQHWPYEVSLPFVKKPANQEVRTTLALGSPLFSDSATSKDQRSGEMANRQELTRRLEENIPWQSGVIPSIIEALHDCRSSEKKGTWLLIQGTDHIGKRRLARVIAEIFCGSTDKLIHINRSKLAAGAISCTEILAEACRKDQKCAVLIENIDRAHPNFLKSIAEGLKNGFFGDAISGEVGLAHGVFILTTSSSTKFDSGYENPDQVMKLKLWVEETESETPHDLKRRPESELSCRPKKSRTEDNCLDLNLCAEEEVEVEEDEDEDEEHDDDDDDDEEDAVPSDLTHETDSGDLELPYELLESSTACFTIDASPGQSCRMSESLRSKLRRAFDEVRGGGEGKGQLRVDQTAVEELMMACGSFLESLFDEWVTEVFQTSLATVKKGGKVRLSVEGKEGNAREFGFQGSPLPNRIHAGLSPNLSM